MAEMFEVKIIARIHSDFPSKFGIPRQSGLVEICSRLSSLNRSTEIHRRCVDWKISPTCG